MREQSGAKLKITIAAAVIVLVVIVVAILMLDNLVPQNKIEDMPGPKEAERARREIKLPGGTFYRKEDVETYLIIGLDTTGKMQSSDSYYNTDQADFLLLIAVDKYEKTCSFLQINRDTMAYVPMLGVTGQKYGTATEQIALAHTYGDGLKLSCENTADAVSTLLFRVPVDYYISMTMDAVAELTDYVGGVEVKLDRDWTDINPSYVCGAEVVLKGSAALDFVRERRSLSDSTNISRMDRQNLFMHGFVDAVEGATMTESFLAGAYEAVEDYILSNANVSKVSELVSGIHDYTFTDLKAPAGEAYYENEFAEFYVDAADLERIVKDIWCE